MLLVANLGSPEQSSSRRRVTGGPALADVGGVSPAGVGPLAMVSRTAWFSTPYIEFDTIELGASFSLINQAFCMLQNSDTMFQNSTWGKPPHP